MGTRPTARRVAVGLTALLFCVWGWLAGCSRDEPPVGKEQRALDMTPKEDLGERALAILNEKCTRCHGAERFEARNFSAAEWEQVIERMTTKGAHLSGDEREVLRHWREGP